MTEMPTFIVYSVVAILALQLALIAMMHHVYANKNVKRMSNLLEEQNERIAKELHAAIAKGTNAAHAAYEVANTVNEKLEAMGLRQEAKVIEAIHVAQEKEQP